jgi:hypothetical protein
MKRLYQKIQIDDRSFTQDLGCEIIKSRDNFTQTCVITFPNVLFKNTNEAVAISSNNKEPLIQRNDIVKVWSGYNKAFDDLPLRFSGFVNRIEVNEDIKVYCEDYGFVLKQINVPSKDITKEKLNRDVLITDVVEYILQGANINVEYDSKTTKVGDWFIDNNSNINAIQALEKLEPFGIRCYFIGTTLRIGGVTDISEQTRNFIFEHNIAEDNLIYRQDDKMNISIKGISNLESNEKITRYAYLEGTNVVLSDTPISGGQITLNYYNKNKEELDEALTNNFNKYIFEGYSGSFTTFLEPITEPNDTINLWSLEFPERNGAYKCKSVRTIVDNNGGWQEIELDYKIRSLNEDEDE